MRITSTVGILLLLVLSLPASPAHASGVVIVCDEAHLLAALAGGGTVMFTCSGTITLTDQIVIAADTTIDGAGQAVTISGNDAVRVFNVAPGTALNLNELTVANGSAYVGGGVYVDEMATVAVSNCVFSGNSAEAGGGIFNLDGAVTVTSSIFSGNNATMGGGIDNRQGALVVSNSTFTENVSGHSGGGIRGHITPITVTNSTFSANSSVYGGGIFNYLGALTVSESSFVDNTASVKGGGIDNDGSLTLSESRLSGNSAMHGGGVFSDRTAVISDTIFADNDATLGGGVFGWAAPITVTNSTFTGNSADAGGGIYNQRHFNTYRTLAVSDSAFLDNSADSGGAILNHGILAVRNSTFSDNHAIGFQGDGGAVLNDGEAAIAGCVFSGNDAREQGNGGAISNGGNGGDAGRALMTVANSTFTGNAADYGVGGAIYAGIYGGVDVLIIVNSTLSGNTAGLGGGIFLHGGTATLKNTIVANNRPGGNCRGNQVADGGGNLSYPGTACPGINGDPVLGPLQDNGGPTWTMALGRGSAAIDAANDATCAAEPVNNLDQRGISRPQGANCDIGAVEQTPYLPLPPRQWLPAVLSES